MLRERAWVLSCTHVACRFIYCYEIVVVKWIFKFIISQCTLTGIAMYRYVAACRLMCAERGMNCCNKRHANKGEPAQSVNEYLICGIFTIVEAVVAHSLCGDTLHFWIWRSHETFSEATITFRSILGSSHLVYCLSRLVCDVTKKGVQYVCEVLINHSGYFYLLSSSYYRGADKSLARPGRK